MGREIRRVPPNWEHPRKESNPEHHQPMYETNYLVAGREWVEGLLRWERGENPAKEKYGDDFFWDWEGPPPDSQYCVPYDPAEFKETGWWQVYETVSEGTPVTPAFATPEELIDYLATKGDFWDQRLGTPPPSREAAERFVKAGWVPSMVIGGGKIATGIEIASTFPAKESTDD